MAENTISLDVQKVSARELLAEFRQIPIFQHVKEQDLECLGEIDIVHVAADTVVIEPGTPELYFWILLEGEVRVNKPEADGGDTLLGTLKHGDTSGEVALLTGATATSVRAVALMPARAIRMSASSFWSLMGTCPTVRSGILSNMGRRLEAYQMITLHREKLISLGTLAAGLMHELNNPGTAAKRAASQLRENLTRLQEISLRFTRMALTPEQKDCMRNLQQEVLRSCRFATISTLDQADAEDELADWLDSIGVVNAWQLAPTLVAIGWKREDIECAHAAFPAEILSDTLNWLTSLISSIQLVGTVEESITRVTDLVVAVKKYAYDDKSRQREIDVHESIISTLTILAHKFRHKGIAIEKKFSPDMAKVKSSGTGLSQVWTNILDNAIDAAPEGGKIVIRTWMEGSEVLVGICDNGPGISMEDRQKIFEPFFTTKAVGVGTGLGLDIAHRVVVGQFNGDITFNSEPGSTEFIVRLPSEKK
ncbi:ATP-binding protein [Silvibacterium acidisoli]|uniref:ATP-binding protein n=1 Tax=Acidobacteriaceae bacterium ZG23-2 TaxID=2883246 RepID=UPI00406BE49C